MSSTSRTAHLRHHPHWTALAALIEDIGPPCWAAYDTAGELHAFDGYELAPPFDLLVPKGRNIQRVGHRVHVSNSIPQLDCEVAVGLPCMSPTRALLQIASNSSPDRLAAAFGGAIRDRLTTEDFMHRRIGGLRASGRNGILPMLRVLEQHELHRGGQSWLENEFLRLIQPLGHPRPRTQAVLGRRGDRLIRVDFWFDGTPIVVETLGYRWHRTTAQIAIDAERYNRLVLNGYVPFQFTYTQVVDEPALVVGTLAEAFERWGTARPTGR